MIRRAAQQATDSTSFLLGFRGQATRLNFDAEPFLSVKEYLVEEGQT